MRSMDNSDASSSRVRYLALERTVTCRARLLLEYCSDDLAFPRWPASPHLYALSCQGTHQVATCSRVATTRVRQPHRTCYHICYKHRCSGVCDNIQCSVTYSESVRFRQRGIELKLLVHRLASLRCNNPREPLRIRIWCRYSYNARQSFLFFDGSRISQDHSV